VDVGELSAHHAQQQQRHAAADHLQSGSTSAAEVGANRGD